jgi:hypothetical protein
MRAGGGGAMAKASRGSVAARAVALVFAIALAALAARLWLGGAPREASRATSAESERADGERDAASEPPLHGPHAAEDEEALRDILRGGEPPGAAVEGER